MGGVTVDGGLLGSLLRKRATITGTTLRNRDDAYKAALVQAFTTSALPRLATGDLKPVVDRIVPLAEVQAAHEAMESNANTGKILLRVADLVGAGSAA